MTSLKNLTNTLKLVGLALLVTLLSACGDDKTQSPRQAMAIENSDECHLCGMLIQEFPGPKGELYLKTSETVKKFCSTRDLFTFLLDPEYQNQVKEIYVHDMSKAPWEAPLDSHFIDGRSAWYVSGSSQLGSMGKTLASFGTEQAARDFIQSYGGKLFRFEEVKLEML